MILKMNVDHVFYFSSQLDQDSDAESTVQGVDLGNAAMFLIDAVLKDLTATDDQIVNFNILGTFRTVNLHPSIQFGAFDFSLYQEP